MDQNKKYVELLVTHYIYIQIPSIKFNQIKNVNMVPLFSYQALRYFPTTTILDVGNNTSKENTSTFI